MAAQGSARWQMGGSSAAESLAAPPLPTCSRSQWESMSEAVAAPLDRRRSSSAKPKEASAGR